MVNAIGSLTASNTAVVRAQVSGVLQSIQFQEGQQVKAGQILAQIDPRAFAATFAQSEGALARDTAQLENAKVDLARYRLPVIELYRGAGASADAERWNLPGIIPTQPQD